MTWVLEPLSFPFLQRAALGCVAIGIAAPLLGCWAVSRRLVYLTDAMSHAVLAGVAAAALLGVGLLAGAFAAALVMALLVAVLTLRVRLPEDSAVGVVGQGLFAVGVLGISVLGDPRALSHVLFGNPLTLIWSDVAVQGLLATTVVAAAWLLAPVLTATSFDAVHARTVGIRVGLVDTTLIVGLGLVVVIGLTTVGVLMAVTLAVAPAVAARLLLPRMALILPAAAGLGVLAGLLGLLLSYHLSLPTGPLVAVVAVGEVALAATARLGARGARRVVVADRGGHRALPTRAS